MKKYMMVVLAVTMILGIQLEASASVVYDSVDGDLSIEEDGIEAPLSKEEQEWNAIKDEWVQETEETFKARSSQGIYAELSMQHFRQTNDHYCGPATVKQTIHYLAGKSLGQGDYAKQLGTTADGTIMANIPGVINANVSLTTGYTMRSIGSKNNYTSNIYTALSKKRPVIIDIKGGMSDGWPYNTPGHYLNVAGIKSNATTDQIMVVDPNRSESSQWYATDLVYQMNNQHPHKAFIW